MRILVLVCLVLAIGCRGTARVHKPGDEWLAAIEIEGSRAIPRDELVPGLSLNRALSKRAVDLYQLGIDTDRIRAAYLRLGFFDVEVTSRVETRPQDGAIAQTAIFKVVEGRRSTSQVEIRGLPPEVAPARARAAVALADGAPFDYAAFDAAKPLIYALVEDAGYPNVLLEAAVQADRARGVATAVFEVTPGQRATFGEISITGIDGDLAEAIRGRLTFRTGDAYSASAIAAAQVELYDLGRFSTVRIDPERSGGAVVPIKISVTIGKLREVRGGFGLGYDPVTVELRGRLGASVIPLSHPLWTLSTDVRPALTFAHQFDTPGIKVRAISSAYRIDLFRPRVRGELEASADFLTLEAYRTYGPRFRAGISSPLGVPWLSGRIGWLFEYLFFDKILIDEAERPALHLDEPQRRGALEVSLEADLRDNKLEPRFGLLASLRASQGSPYLGGASAYSQVTPELRFYLPIGSRLVLAGRARLGLLFGDVPVTERYYSGGASNQRGFPDRRLSPTVHGTSGGTVDGVPIGDPGFYVVGGTGMIETGLELRIPLGELLVPFGTHLFGDGGDVVLDPNDLDPFDLHWAVGVGLYAQIAGLKVRFDVGHRVTRTGDGERTPDTVFGKNLVLHFGVGETY